MSYSDVKSNGFLKFTGFAKHTQDNDLKMTSLIFDYPSLSFILCSILKGSSSKL